MEKIETLKNLNVYDVAYYGRVYMPPLHLSEVHTPALKLSSAFNHLVLESGVTGFRFSFSI